MNNFAVLCYHDQFLTLHQDPDNSQRQKALYSATCVHASFGDAEVAKLALRGKLTGSFGNLRCILHLNR